MKCYTVDEVIEEVSDADLVFGMVSLNAAEFVEARIKKKSLLERLHTIKGRKLESSNYFMNIMFDDKNRKIIKFV